MNEMRGSLIVTNSIEVTIPAKEDVLEQRKKNIFINYRKHSADNINLKKTVNNFITDSFV